MPRKPKGPQPVSASQLQEVVEQEVRFRLALREVDLGPEAVPFSEFPGRTPGWSVLGAEGQLSVDDDNPLADATRYSTHTKVARQLYRSNPFAINAVDNVGSFIIGSGITHDVAWKDPETEPDDALMSKVRSAIMAFEESSGLAEYTVEMSRRYERDGELFVRGFVRPGKPLAIRMVEPDQVYTPTQRVADSYADSSGVSVPVKTTLGVVTPAQDAIDPVAYYIDGGVVPASTITGFVRHWKNNVDRNNARGISTLWPVRNQLYRADGMLVKLSALMDIRMAISMIRKHKASNRQQIEHFAQNRADTTVPRPGGGSTGSPLTSFLRRHGPGMILDTNENIEYVFPDHTINAADLVDGLQAVLRSVASRLQTPEHWLTARLDAKYSNALAAESPTVKFLERRQATIAGISRAIVREAVLAAGVSAEELAQVDIVANTPKVQVRDPLQQAQVNQILFQNAILSRQTWTADAGFEYDAEQRFIDEDEARNGGVGSPLPAGPDDNPEPAPDAGDAGA